MASGMGIKGNIGRCFYYFQDHQICLKNDEDPLKHCRVTRDDYLECLHNRKERTRKEIIHKQELKNIQAAKDLAAGKVPVAIAHGGH